MANYDVSIRLAVAGAKELDRVNKRTDQLRKNIDFINKKAQAGTAGTPVVRNFKNLSKAVTDANDALNEAAVGTKEFNQAVKNLVQVENKYNRTLKQRERRLKIQRLAAKEGISFSKAKILLTKQEAQAEATLALAKEKTASAERRKRIGSTISSAAIGGAFPLLFGQTGAAAVGGGLGGLAGGAIGGQFGFALSIVGTAIGSAIDKNDKFNQSLAVLNVRFSDVSGSAQLTSEDIDKVAKRLRITKEEAFGVLGAFAQFGSGSIAKSLTEIFGADAGAFDSIATANRQAELANKIFEARTKIGNEVATQLLNQNLITDSATIELALAEARAKAENDIAVAQAKQIKFSDKARDLAEELLFRGGGDPSRFGENRANKLQKEFEEGRNKRMKDFKEALEQVREMLGLVNEANNQFGQSGVLAMSAINDKVKDLQDELKKLASPISLAIGLSDTMANSFENSFKGIIKGTMTVADAFRNMLNRIADHFLDTAARMLANQFQQGILGLLGGLFNPLNSARLGAQATAMTGIPSGADLLPGSFANGGRPPVGRPSIVGERGAELFVPDRAGTIIPNHELGGSTNIVVNVDASGSNVEGDEDEGRALGIALSAAIETELIKQKRPGGLLA